MARNHLLGHLGKGRVLDEQAGRIDAHARDAAIEPEPQDVLVLAPHVGVVPVEVGLFRREQVQVPLPRRSVGVRGAGPRVALEVGDPVGGHLVAVRPLAGVEPEAFALGRPRPGGQRSLEPRVLARDVVRHDVDDGADAEGERLGDEELRIFQRAERRVDVAVVGDVVAAVGEGGRIPRVEPERVDAEFLQVAEPAADAPKVARAIAVGIGEAAHVDLVDHGAPPPQRVVHEGRGRRFGIREGHDHAAFLLSSTGLARRVEGDDGVDVPQRNESNRMTQLFNIRSIVCDCLR